MMKKGISPLVATVLLVSITIVVAAVVASWANFFIKGKTDDIDKASDDEKVCQFANMRSIEDLKSYSSVENEVSIGINNNGRVPLSNFTFVVKYNDSTIGTTIPPSETINPAGFAILTANTTQGKAPSEVTVLSNCPDVSVKITFP